MGVIYDIYIYLYIYISRNVGGQGIHAPTGAVSRDLAGSFLIWDAFLYRKRPGRVLHAMGPKEQVRTQQSRASGAVYLWRYGRFCDP